MNEEEENNNEIEVIELQEGETAWARIETPVSPAPQRQENFLDISLGGENLERALSSNMQSFSGSPYVNTWGEFITDGDTEMRYSERARSTTRASLIRNVAYLPRLPNSSQLGRTPLRLIRPGGTRNTTFVSGFELQDPEDRDIDDDDDSEEDEEESDLEDASDVEGDVLRQISGLFEPESMNNELDNHLSYMCDDSDNESDSIDISGKLVFPNYLLVSSFGQLRKSQQSYIDKFLQLNSLHSSDSDSSWVDSLITLPSPPLSSEPPGLPSTQELMESSQNYTVSKKAFRKLLEKQASIRKSLEFPTQWNRTDLNKNIKVLDDMLQADYIGSGRDDEDSGMVRSNWPMPSTCGVYYYEVTIVSKGRNGYIGIGFCSGKVSLSRLPGWDPDSWGYHGDDGNSFKSNGHGSNYGPKFTTGDVIGCGMNFITHEAFFVKNGVYLGAAFRDLNPSFPLYPSIGMRTPGEKVKANFGQQPFIYDIESYINSQKNTLWETIMNTPIKEMVKSSTAKCLENPSTNPAISYFVPVQNSDPSDITTHQAAPDFLQQPANQPGFIKISSGIPVPTEGALKSNLLFTLMDISKGDASAKQDLPSEKDTMNELVLSYLIHHGHNKTAEAFTKNVLGINSESAKDSLNLDRLMQIKKLLFGREQQVARRKEICDLIDQGRVLNAIKLLQNYYPSIINTNRNLIFNLRCQHFIELARLANSGPNPVAELISSGLANTHSVITNCNDTSNANVFDYQKRFGSKRLSNNKEIVSTSVANEVKTFDGTAFEMDSAIETQPGLDSIKSKLQSSSNSNNEVESVMDIDDVLPPPISNLDSDLLSLNVPAQISPKILPFSDTFPDIPSELSSISSPQEAAKAIMIYGQKLNSYYSSFEDEYLDSTMANIFSLMAFSDPMNHHHTKALFELSKRNEVAKLTNSEILYTEGNLPSSPLETIYKQVDFCVSSMTEKFLLGSTSVLSLSQRFGNEN